MFFFSAHYQKDPFDIYIVRFVKKEEVPDFYNQIPKYWPDLVKRAAFVEDKVVRFIGKLSNVSGTNFRKKTNFIGHSVGGYLAERIAHYLRPFAHAFFISGKYTIQFNSSLNFIIIYFIIIKSL